MTLGIKQPGVLQPGGGGGWGRELEEVVTVTSTVAATISDTADKAGEAVSTSRASTNNISHTGEE